MPEPRLHHLLRPATPPAPGGTEAGTARRIAWWEWNETGDPAHPRVVVCMHGLTRQGRDFDALARDFAPHGRVVCPDAAGRGQSDRLADPAGYAVPTYAADLAALLAHVHARAPVGTLDFIGTSMGGLIGMALCSLPPGTPGALPVPVQHLVLNDIGPQIEWPALQRLGRYVGRAMRFGSAEEAAAGLRAISPGFGPHTDAEWAELSRAMVRPCGGGAPGVELHYDPEIARAFDAITPESSEQAAALMWACYDRIPAQTRVLLIRGADSDLLSAETARAMAQRGPGARLLEFDGVGHAPTFVAEDQRRAVRAFLGIDAAGADGGA
ncbi:MAG: alpha/beta hydrolase [Xylophilus ampelinus]